MSYHRTYRVRVQHTVTVEIDVEANSAVEAILEAESPVYGDAIREAVANSGPGEIEVVGARNYR